MTNTNKNFLHTKSSVLNAHPTPPTPHVVEISRHEVYCSFIVVQRNNFWKTFQSWKLIWYWNEKREKCTSLACITGVCCDVRNESQCDNYFSFWKWKNSLLHPESSGGSWYNTFHVWATGMNITTESSPGLILCLNILNPSFKWLINPRSVLIQWRFVPMLQFTVRKCTVNILWSPILSEWETMRLSFNFICAVKFTFFCFLVLLAG